MEPAHTGQDASLLCVRPEMPKFAPKRVGLKENIISASMERIMSKYTKVLP